MTDPEPQDGTVVRVETDRVDGVIRLDDLVARIREGAAARAGQARRAGQTVEERGGADAGGGQEALTRISELAAQLSDELARLGPLDE